MALPVWSAYAQRCKVIAACVCVNQLYINVAVSTVITSALELPRKQANWMCSKFNVNH